jgi:sugar phosphate isomerase/epimerase
MKTPLLDDLKTFSSAGISRIGFLKDKLDEVGWTEGIQAVKQSDIEVAYLVHIRMFTLDDPGAWKEQSESLIRTLDAAAEIGAKRVYGTSGPAGSLSWEQAADAFAAAVQAPADHAKQLGIELLLENSNQLNYAYNFAYTVGDLDKIAEMTGLGICVELFHCWRERGLDQTLRHAAQSLSMLQISDYVPGIVAMGQRAVPGDGIIPLERIIRTFVDVGFHGLFDLEILGPRIDEEGPVKAILRGVEYVSSILDRLGVT